MNASKTTLITVQTVVKLPVVKVWELWTIPHHILHWNFASDDWQTTRAVNDLRSGGNFLSHMEAKDGSVGFDFYGKYDAVVIHKRISCTLGDTRKVDIVFNQKGDETEITESFETEETNTAELQRTGWQSILNNFRKYAESSENLDILHFEITINCPLEKVYETMFREDSYKSWTSLFNSSSHYAGSWEKGSKILFLGTDSKGAVSGMVSRIKENLTNEFVSIEHLGIVKNGQEIICGREADQWRGTLENYTYSGLNGKTLLSVDIDSNQEFKSYFSETWPEALKKLKSICE